MRLGLVKAALHPQQAARLAALRAYEILDTPREADFDELVELASTICEAPISVINLIDAERQWFKAEVGLGVRETPLDTSICSHAILEDEFVEIPDTLSDCRMEGNALCTGDPGLRFYAGALLKTADGLPLGTLCVLDYKPRDLNEFQKRAMRVLARQVMKQLDLRQALKTQALLLSEVDHRVKNSLQTVSSLVRIQRGKSQDEAVRAALDEVSQRLHTISLVHEELGRSSAADEVDLARYLTRLAGLLQDNAPANVRLLVGAESIMAESRLASSIGMIVSEFAANSLKHAFPDNRAGTVTFTLRRVGEHAAELTCEDDGVGAPVAIVGERRRGLGLRIIEASAAQLGGRIEPDEPSRGARFRTTFPLVATQTGDTHSR